jgi:hypothetical protein
MGTVGVAGFNQNKRSVFLNLSDAAQLGGLMDESAYAAFSP